MRRKETFEALSWIFAVHEVYSNDQFMLAGILTDPFQPRALSLLPLRLFSALLLAVTLGLKTSSVTLFRPWV